MIFIAGIFIILVIFLFSSTPLVNQISPPITSVKPVGTIILDREDKVVGTILLDRYILGIPEELQNDAVFVSNEGGDIAIIPLRDPMNLAVSWDNNWDTIVNWQPQSCQLTLAEREGIYQSNIAGDEITPIVNYSALNPYPAINRAYYFPSPDMRQVMVWSPQGEFFSTGMDTGYFESEDLYLFSINPSQPGELISPNHGATTVYHQRLSSNGWARWSPDSRYFAFIDFDTNGIYQLFLYDLQTSTRTQITNLSEPRPVLYNANIYGLRFSPDSNYLLASYYPHYDQPYQDEVTLIWDIAQAEVVATLDADQYRILHWQDDHSLLLLDVVSDEFVVFDIIDNCYSQYEGYLSSPFFDYWGFFIPNTNFYIFFYANLAAHTEDLRVVDVSTGRMYLIPGVTQYTPYLREYIVYLHVPEEVSCFSNP